MLKWYADDYLLEILRQFHVIEDSISWSDYESFRKSRGGPKPNTFVSRFGSWGNAIDKADLPHDFDRCSECGNLYSKLGLHWRFNPSHEEKIYSDVEEIPEIENGYCVYSILVERKSTGEEYYYVGMSSNLRKRIDDHCYNFTEISFPNENGQTQSEKYSVLSLEDVTRHDNEWDARISEKEMFVDLYRKGEEVVGGG